jgi:hypothetical protein
MTRNVQSRRATIGGITFGTVDDDGVLWGLDTLDGWGSPSTTAEYTQKPRDHGAFSNGDAYLNERTVACGGIVAAPSVELRAQAEDRLCAAFAVNLTKLEVVEPGRSSRWAMVRRDGEVLTPQLSDLAFQWSAQVKAPDPRKYGDEIAASTGLPAKSGGLTWPVKWPIAWTGVAASGVISVANPGNIASPLVLRVYGPVTGPRIRHVASGVELVLASSYTVGAGSYLEIDMANRTVLEGGKASRNGWLTERGFFLLDPGPNDLIFSAAAYNPDAQLELTAYPAYQ